MKQIKVYTVTELKKKFPDGFDNAYEKFKEDQDGNEIPWSDEIMPCLKEIFKVAGITLNGWSIGAYSNCYVTFTISTYWSDLADNDELVDNLEGQKAYKWLKETFELKSYKRVNYKDHLGKPAHRYDFQKLDGKDWSCEFTGICFDHDFLESLFDCIYDGMNIKDAFHNLADVAGKLEEAEFDYMMSEENFIESSSDDQFTKDGVKI